MPIAPGTKLGQYEVQDFIGQGAMGLVYRAFHPELERTGAVKVLQAISPDADTVARFRHEAQAIAQLRHPNIVNVYDFGEYQGTPYMIVEYVPGGSLAARMSQGRLEPAVALRYLRGIAAGLDYAHAHGIVHRDVKPANVLLMEDDTPVLADFGLAKLMQGSSLKSMTGVTTGTPAYMAPEQVMGGKVTPAADRYALATIGYEMLTGVIPFNGEALMELLYAQVHREPTHPSEHDASLGPHVDAVIMRGLAKDPASRWESCAAFVDALAAALNGLAAPARARTMVLTHDTPASTVPLAAVAVPPTTPVVAPAALAAAPSARKVSPATIAIPFPQAAVPPVAAPAGTAKSNRRPVRRIAVAAAAVLILLLVMGTCAVLAQATTLSVSPNRAARGDTVTVHATHVPAAKAGEIQLWSVVHTFPFQADSKGNVTTDFAVPRDVALGDHVVKICWDNACHAQAPLKVVAGLAEVLPTPVGNATPVSTPNPTPTAHAGSTPTPTGSSTPTPRSGGGGGGGGGSTPPPTNPPTSTPTPNPCPGNNNQLALSPTTQSVLLGGTARWTGANFTPNSSVTLSYYSPSTAGTPTKTWSAIAACGGGFTTSTTVPGGLLRTDKITACDIRKGCVSATVSVVA